LHRFTLINQIPVAEISLAVTKAVLEYTKAPREKERQIAYTAASPDIAARLGDVTKQNHVKVRLWSSAALVDTWVS
jgi:hypothetical protein